ncbi:four helix bundle protein [candidate division KSB1 bacterium]|nr:MAG: four helix bundle protein [candidate division KSB1 bacterium]
MSEKLTDFRQLNVWQKAHKLVLEIYEITKKFPKEEKSEIVSRMRSAAESVPVNIGSGFMRREQAEKERFYKLSQEGIEKVKYYLILTKDLGMLKDNDEILLAAMEVGRMLTGLVRSAKINS